MVRAEAAPIPSGRLRSLFSIVGSIAGVALFYWLAIGTGDHQLPMVRAEARPTRVASARSTADVALFYGLAIGTSAKCVGGQGWWH